MMITLIMRSNLLISNADMGVHENFRRNLNLQKFLDFR